MKPRYRAVIFDMDGLLFDTEQTGCWAWDKALEDHGFRMTDEIYLKFVGRDMSHREAVLRAHFGDAFPFESVKAQRIALGDAKEIADGLPLKPGVADLLETLAKAGIPIGLATGTARSRTLRRLADAGIESYFGAVVTGQEVPNGKPAPDLFLEASRRLCVAPEACIVFEDSCAGITAATQAGMCSIMVPDLERPTPEVAASAFQVLDSLTAAPPVVETLCGIATISR